VKREPVNDFNTGVMDSLKVLEPGWPIREALVETLRAFYARHGAAFIVLPNRSQYPRRLFFDTMMHLRQGGQMAHSELVADALAPFVR